MKRIFGLVLWLLCCVFLGNAGALEATMTPPEVMFRDRKLLVSSKLDVDFNHRLKEALDSGLEIRFFFTLELYRVRSWWWDENVITMPVVYAVKYDNLKKEYLVGTGEEGEHQVMQDYLNMKNAILLLKDIPLSLPDDWDNSPEEKYYLRVMGEMPSFDPNFLFFSTSEFSTPWGESQEFTIPFSSPSLPEESPEKEKKEGSVP